MQLPLNTNCFGFQSHWPSLKLLTLLQLLGEAVVVPRGQAVVVARKEAVVGK